MTNLGSRLENYRISCGGCDQYKGILFMMMVRNENKHVCSFCFCKNGQSLFPSYLLPYRRSEGFARAAYFVPGCDGAGVWQDSEILPAPSLLENVHPNTSKTPKKSKNKKITIGS